MCFCRQEDSGDGRGCGYNLTLCVEIFPRDKLVQMLCKFCGRCALDVNWARPNGGQDSATSMLLHSIQSVSEFSGWGLVGWGWWVAGVGRWGVDMSTFSLASRVPGCSKEVFLERNAPIKSINFEVVRGSLVGPGGRTGLPRE